MTRYYCLIEQNNLAVFDTQKGVTFFNRHLELVSLARIMLGSSYYKLDFYYQTDSKNKTKPMRIQFVVDEQEDLVRAIANIEQIAFGLTVRELQIITLLSAGLSDGSIGEHLFISHRTVGKHIQHIFEKTGVDSRTALAVLAGLHGLYHLPSHLPKHDACYKVPILHLWHLSSLTSTAKPQRTKISTLAPLRIGIPFAAKGRGVIDSTNQKNGAKLAIAYINAQAKLDRKLELVFEPFEADNDASIIQAYQNLIDNEVDGISAGYACYNLEAYELVASYGLPYLHTATSDKAVRHACANHMGNVFQLCASDVNYGLGIIRFIQTYQHLWRYKTVIVIKPSWQLLDIGRMLCSLYIKWWGIWWFFHHFLQRT